MIIRLTTVTGLGNRGLLADRIYTYLLLSLTVDRQKTPKVSCLSMASLPLSEADILLLKHMGRRKGDNSFSSAP